MKYLMKEDLATSIWGLEQYHPGKRSTKELGIKITSGTTGKPVLIVLKNVHLKRKKPIYTGHHTSYVRLTPKYAPYVNQANNLLRNTSKMRQILFLDKKDITDRHLESLLHEFAPTEIHSTPSYLVHLLQVSVLKTIEYIWLGGELVCADAIRFIKKKIPRATIHINYGLGEADVFTESCTLLSRMYKDMPHSVFHLLVKYHKIEVLDPDKDGFGELILSTPEFSNYKTGDIGKLVAEQCVCGSKNTLIVLGRIDFDIVHCAGATILLSQLERVFEPLGMFVEDYYVEVQELITDTETVGKISLWIVPTARLLRKQHKERFISDVVTANLQMTQTKTLSQLILEGKFQPMKIVINPSLPQQTSSKKIKLRKIT